MLDRRNLAEKLDDLGQIEAILSVYGPEIVGAVAVLAGEPKAPTPLSAGAKEYLSHAR